MMKSSSGASDGTMMKSSGSMTVSDSERKMSADPMDISAYNLKGLGPQVVAFTTEMAAWDLARTKTVIYFFAATWCPDCQATYRDLKTAYKNIPSNVVLVFVNYDKALDLRTKYGITAQHTFVVVGGDGMAKKTWAGTDSVADIVRTATSM